MHSPAAQRNPSSCLPLSRNVRLQYGRDELVCWREHADVLPDPYYGAVQPWQLERTATFQVLQHGRLRGAGQRLKARHDFVEDWVGREMPRACATAIPSIAAA